MKYNINYFDLGTHKGQEIDMFLKQIKKETWINNINIYGIEAHPVFYKTLLKKYKNKKYIQFYFYNIAVGSKDKKKVKLYLHPSNMGHSIYSDKSEVSKKSIIVEQKKFSEWLKEECPPDKYSVNIIKANIEGAEWDLVNDLNKNKLLNYFNIYLGSAPGMFNDISKVKSLVKKEAVKKCSEILKSNKIRIKKFCWSNPKWKNTDLKKEIKKIIQRKEMKRKFKNVVEAFHNDIA